MHKVVRVASSVFFAFLLFVSSLSLAQNMSNVRVDELSDQQVRQFMNQVNSSGLSESQLEQVALARGMAPAEISKLRNRVNELKLAAPKSTASSLDSQLRQDSDFLADSLSADSLGTKLDSALDALKSKIFGASLFQNANPQFAPNLNIATPRNYVIGAGDELMIEIYGYSEASHSLTVTPEGNINIPYVGVVSVAGATIEQASSRIKSRLASVYSGISTGNTNVNITIANLRSIKVVLAGDVVMPGTYTLPSLATVFNALYSSGGPTENGSMRDIRIIRNGEQIATLDVYDFLADGSLDDNITLQDQDIVFVPPYVNRVEVIGEVKRPALFEIKAGESFAELLAYAGGFTPNAYQNRIKVLRNTTTERRIEDLLQSQFTQYEPQQGDKFIVDRIIERFENRVSINGSVFRPGDYELSPGLTLSMLIKKADGVTEDAFLEIGYISRLKPDLQAEHVSFNVADVLAGTAPDIILQREDQVFISSIFDLRDEYDVRIEGEIRLPGTYSYGEGMTVRELILQAGGFTESASPKRIEISRRIKSADGTGSGGTIADIFHIDLDRGLDGESGDFVLEPYDFVAIRTAPDYHSQKTVRIEGEVLYPGVYTIKSKTERLTDLLERAGGTTEYAYMEGASLKRIGKKQDTSRLSRTDSVAMALAKEEEKNQLLTLQQLQSDVSDVNMNTLRQSISNDYVGVDFKRILNKPNSKENLLLQDGDVIMIPRELQTVKVSGEVLSPVTAVYNNNKGFKYYISQAGGFSQKALKRRAYVVHANGSAQSTSNFLFFKFYPQVKPGSQIFVPQKEEKERLSPQAWVGMGSGIASVAAIIFSIINNSK